MLESLTVVLTVAPTVVLLVCVYVIDRQRVMETEYLNAAIKYIEQTTKLVRLQIEAVRAAETCLDSETVEELRQAVWKAEST